MNQDPLTIVFVTVVSVFVLKLWLADYWRHKSGAPDARALPGATSVGSRVLVFGTLVAVSLVLVETWGEYRLGLTDKQSSVTWLFLLGMLSAGFIEELIFRGFLVIDGRGRRLLVASILGFSALFALLHFHWIDWKGLDAGLVEFRFTPAAAWWTLLLFLNSLLFYWLRFCRWNPKRSLVPCFVAHIASNVAVFLVKLAQGFVVAVY